MSKNFELKKQAVAEITEKIKNAKSLVIVEYKGLTVDEATQLRAKCRAAKVDYCVLKNTLVRRALADLNITGLDSTLEGPSAFVFSTEDPVSGAKILKEFMEADKKEAIKVKAGLLDGRGARCRGREEAGGSAFPRGAPVHALSGAFRNGSLSGLCAGSRPQAEGWRRVSRKRPEAA